MEEKQIEQILKIVRSINYDEFDTELTTENSFDSVMLELHFLLSKLSSQKNRIRQIISHISESCLGNLDNVIPISDEQDELDVISLGFNTFLEELNATTVSKVELELANKEIAEREQKLDEAQRIAKIGSWEFDPVTNKSVWSRQLFKIFEIDPNTTEPLLPQFRDKIHPDDTAFFRRILDSGSVEKKYMHEFRLRINENSFKYILATIYTKIDSVNKKHLIGTFQDITERKLAERKLIELEQLETRHKKKLIEAILFTKEKEQKRMAQELHDDIGSSLMVIKFAIHKFDVAEEKKQELYDSISEIVTKVRNLSNELSPNVLEEFGLINAVKHFTLLINKSTNVLVSYHSDFEYIDVLSKEEEISIYRIIQEIVTNILKYAEATLIKIFITKTNKIFRLTIEDNGNGFIPSPNFKSSFSLGLLNIESRIEYIQGKIEYQPREPKGTIVVITKKIK